MNSSSIRLGILFIAILAVGVLVNTWAYLGEAHVDRKPLKDFPDQIGAWQKMGSDQSTRSSNYAGIESERLCVARLHRTKPSIS